MAIWSKECVVELPILKCRSHPPKLKRIHSIASQNLEINYICLKRLNEEKNQLGNFFDNPKKSICFSHFCYEANLKLPPLLATFLMRLPSRDSTNCFFLFTSQLEFRGQGKTKCKGSWQHENVDNIVEE